MFKKVHIQNPHDATCTEKTHYIECTECRTRAKSVIYICASGHVISKTCQDDNGNEGGDNIPERDYGPNNPIREPKKSFETIKTEDLASGDHDAVVIKSNSEGNKNARNIVGKVTGSKSNPETTIEYKNENFLESKSSETLTVETCKNIATKEELSKFKVVLRPVICPVSNCSKMVTINTITLHFHFDHSKVPRIVMVENEPQEVLLKPGSVTTEIQCIATYFIKNDSASKEDKLLLLMAVKLQTTPSKLPSIKYVSSRIFTRSIHTQTEKQQKNNNVDKVVNAECLSKANSQKSCKSKAICDDDEDILLLWLCKLDDEENVYSITVMGQNPKRGYSYIGNATHIREKQDPSSLHEKSECLIVKRSAISSLCKVSNQIPVIVRIVN
ncbi:uncharacterized protein LOC113502511 isoform X2 [Trichoplusia ni]|uniref:Uncharacterized protein LOC113502511 isoform X2 n=1 Tax=Trichoplusia ni TaxID=7111 RepID=A0A7E5WGS2_TRINI|nr:uncharacterized protein LOC113502511 isoform X2 [Trichoplusia ni]